MPQDDLFGDSRGSITLPPIIFGPKKWSIGYARCMLRQSSEVSATSANTVQISPKISVESLSLSNGERIIITHRKLKELPAGIDGVLGRDEGRHFWQCHKLLDAFEAEIAAKGWAAVADERSKSWDDKLRFKAERVEADGSVAPGNEGLRPPQLGALHAIGAHWSLLSTPATVVMPTGTGKTETMLATLAAYVRNGPLLVAVPSRVLRDQTANKFLDFGWLPKLDVLPKDVAMPVVGVLSERPKTEADLEFFSQCNVVVATMQSLTGGTATQFAQRIADRTGTLIIDEAHHIPAVTWSGFRDAFRDRRVLQFTATPFREDTRIVEGEVVYNYPLKRAQADKYFKPITFVAIHEMDQSEADTAIAEAALKALREDLSNDLSHVMMARCDNINRANQVSQIYERLAPDLKPMVVHSKLTDTDARIGRLRSGDSRIVVCVDMLGEGFDLPQLKIAAMHDHHKSLAILLQFTGRFTRSSSDKIGDATIVANVADPNVSAALERLYSENADWNDVLSELSSEAATEHAELIQFLNSTQRLDDVSDETFSVSHHLLRPVLSTLVYRAEQFNPKRFYEGLPDSFEPVRVWLNAKANTLFFVTRSQPKLKWTRAKDVRDRLWSLFVVHFNEAQKLLYLSSTDHSSNFQKLAQAVGASSVVEGDVIFRSLGHINRLIFQNVGLKKPGRRNLGFAMYTGADVAEALSIAERGASVKNNVSGTGWEAGRHVAIGCSAKGRIWTREQSPIPRFIRWCEGVGRKLLDESILTDDIIKHVLIPTAVTSLPDAEVLYFEWPNELLRFLEDKVSFGDGAREAHMFAFDLALTRYDRATNVIDFNLTHAESGSWGSFRFTLGARDAYDVAQIGGPAVSISLGKAVRPLAEYLSEYPPLVRFVDLTELDGNHLIGPQNPQTFVIDDERFDAWSWKGVDRRKETAWKAGVHRPDSIQAHVGQHYVDADFDVVFDDDASGEAADLVCMKEHSDHIQLVFVHCKYAGGKNAGERVKDVVEVCSQAVRCAKWNGRFAQLCQHLASRNETLKTEGRSSRFLAGSTRSLSELRRLSRFKEVRPQVIIAQPGLSKSKRSAEQSIVIAAASSYLKETIGVDLDILCDA